MSRPIKHKTVAYLAILLAFFVLLVLAWPTIWQLVAKEREVTSPFKTDRLVEESSSLNLADLLSLHRATPDSVRAVYLSSWVAGNKEMRDKFVRRLVETNVNTVVLDIKDSTGKIFIKLNSPELAKYDAYEVRVGDIKDFLEELHQKDFYIIGKVAVFHDDHLTKIRPDLAMRRRDNNEVWRDDKGIAWLDVSQTEVWDYNITIAREAYSVGFDEINFDYVRFPTDGALSQIRYRNFDPEKETRAEALTKFFVYLNQNLEGIGVKTSANIFGMTLTNQDDLGIGQILENIAPYVDYLAPMLYPSHYPAGWQGYKNPSLQPYKVVSLSLEEGIKRLDAQGWPKEKLRPWLQDFSLGATYTPARVKAQLEAVTDNELTSWMMWNSANKYTFSVY